MVLKYHGESCIAYFEGEINLGTVQKFKEDLSKIDREVEKDIILNFNAVTYINSLGLGAVIELYKKLKMKRKILKIICNSPMVREVFDVVKFSKIIPFFNSDEEVL